jgi:hypothetical protein
LSVLALARLGVSCGLGTVGGILFFLVFFRFYFALAFVLLSGLVLGFLVSASLFFTPFGKSFIVLLFCLFYFYFCGLIDRFVLQVN